MFFLVAYVDILSNLPFFLDHVSPSLLITSSDKVGFSKVPLKPRGPKSERCKKMALKICIEEMRNEVEKHGRHVRVKDIIEIYEPCYDEKYERCMKEKS